mmetsp:Transcript_11356/g.25838  ORF Transcript_11356/g.25838 Transcript_11356/m.25838 type:complete len:213 (+) Transcript_11356:186-824(+)
MQLDDDGVDLAPLRLRAPLPAHRSSLLPLRARCYRSTRQLPHLGQPAPLRGAAMDGSELELQQALLHGARGSSRRLGSQALEPEHGAGGGSGAGGGGREDARVCDAVPGGMHRSISSLLLPSSRLVRARVGSIQGRLSCSLHVWERERVRGGAGDLQEERRRVRGSSVLGAGGRRDEDILCGTGAALVHCNFARFLLCNFPIVDISCDIFQD